MTNQALVIGVEHYTDKTISRVQYAERDATGFAAALKQLNFQPTVLLSAQATKATIESSVRRIAKSLTAADSAYFFFAGHGFSKNDINYLTCRDTARGDLVRTSVELKSAVFSVLRSSKSRRVALFLDACESGMDPDPDMRGIISALNEQELEAFFRESEFYVCFAACKPDEHSYSSSHVSHGIWTYHLIQAISGRAKLAMEKGLVTSSLLQDYLSKEVPLTVRTSRPTPDVQTPWACGAMNRQFVIADLRQELEARKRQKLAAAKEITQALLRGTTTRDVRRLTGFRKGHRVPDAVNAATESFVQKIADEDLRTHLETIYEGLKTGLGYKRRQMKATDNGIETPDFEYTVAISLDREDPSTVNWQHTVSKMTNRDVIFSEGFERTFKAFVDTAEYEFATEFEVEDFIDYIEELDSDEMVVKYRLDEPECDLHIKGFNAVLHLTAQGVRVTKIGNATPRQLLEAIPSAQRLLVSKKIALLPL